MPTLAHRTHAPQSAIRKLMERIPSVAKSRPDGVISLAMGDPTHLVKPMPLLFTKLAEFYGSEDAPKTFGYSPTVGRPHIREKARDFMNHMHPNVDAYKTEEVMVTNGATAAIDQALGIFIQAGKKVATFIPYFSTYEAQALRYEGTFIGIPPEAGSLRPSAENLRQTLREHRDLEVLIFNFPNNPSGVSLTREEWQAIVDVLKSPEFADREFAIILDAVYEEFSLNPYCSMLDVAPELKNNCIDVHSFSKGILGAPDFRAGLVATRPEWIEAMKAHQNATVAGVSWDTQQAIAIGIDAILSQDPVFVAWATEARELYFKHVSFMHAAMEDAFHTKLGLPARPDITADGYGGFFLLADTSALLGHAFPDTVSFTTTDGQTVIVDQLWDKIGARQFRTDTDIANFMLFVAGVAMVPGSGFGLSPEAGLLRLSCAKEMTALQDAVSRLQRALELIPGLHHKAEMTLLQRESLFRPAAAAADGASVGSDYRHRVA